MKRRRIDYNKFSICRCWCNVATAPSVLEYVPARQDVHVLDATAPTAVEYLPATQSVHAVLPVAPLYFPETHLVHVPPSYPDNPAAAARRIFYRSSSEDTRLGYPTGGAS